MLRDSLNKSLFVAGVMLYMGEGAKTGRTVDFTNGSIGLHRVFNSFLLEVCKIQRKRLKLYLYCYDNQDPIAIMNFWSKILFVPKSQFTKPYISKSNGSKRVLPYGVLHQRYSDKMLLSKILHYGNELEKSLVQNLRG